MRLARESDPGGGNGIRDFRDALRRPRTAKLIFRSRHVKPRERLKIISLFIFREYFRSG